jgi:hypothetical protein
VEELGLLRGWSARAFGIALPFIELSLGLFLVAGVGIRVAATLSTVLLVAFTVSMMVSLIQGRKVRCNCFGQLGSTYVSLGSVARNASLLALAGLCLVDTPDYLAVTRLLAGIPLRPDEPVIAELPPLILIWLTIVLIAILISAVRSTGTKIACVEGGPADDLPEVRWIRRFGCEEPVSSSPARGEEE